MLMDEFRYEKQEEREPAWVKPDIIYLRSHISGAFLS